MSRLLLSTVLVLLIFAGLLVIAWNTYTERFHGRLVALGCVLIALGAIGAWFLRNPSA